MYLNWNNTVTELILDQIWKRDHMSMELCPLGIWYTIFQVTKAKKDSNNRFICFSNNELHYGLLQYVETRNWNFLKVKLSYFYKQGLLFLWMPPYSPGTWSSANRTVFWNILIWRSVTCCGRNAVSFEPPVTLTSAIYEKKGFRGIYLSYVKRKLIVVEK
jgi:hypothetical protein